MPDSRFGGFLLLGLPLILASAYRMLSRPMRGRIVSDSRKRLRSIPGRHPEGSGAGSIEPKD